MRKNRKNVFLVIGLLGLGFIVLGLSNKGNADAEKLSDKKVKEIKQERLNGIDEEIQKLQGQETTQQKWKKEGELIGEQEQLEKELHPDEYYKEQIQSEIDTIDVAISDLKSLLKTDGVSEKEVDEWKERIKKYGDVLNEYQKKYNYGEYSSLEDLFQQEHNKVLRLNEYFEEKYN